jgi:hypothetical protein
MTNPASAKKLADALGRRLAAQITPETDDDEGPPRVSVRLFRCFPRDFENGLHDLEAHDFRIALTIERPPADARGFADITEIVPGGGYQAGGAPLQNARIYGPTWTADPVQWTGRGSGFRFQYAVLYNATAPGQPVVAVMERADATGLARGDTVTVEWHEETGILRLPMYFE